MSEYALAALILGLLVTGVYLVALIVGGRPTDKTKLKSLAVPKGSVRALLAFLVVGGYFVVILFGKKALAMQGADATTYTNVVSGLTGLVGSVLGFYFGGKTGAELPGGSDSPESPKPGGEASLEGEVSERPG